MFDAKFKMQVVLEALKKELTISQLADKYDTSVKNIINWKDEFLKNAHLAFEKIPTKDAAKFLQKENKELEKKLKKLQQEKQTISQQLQNLDTATKKILIKQTTTELSVMQQCKLLHLNRPTLYYKPRNKEEKNAKIIEIIKNIQNLSPKNLGYRKIYAQLKKQGIEVGINKVHKLMQQLIDEQTTSNL